jgi:hypothetical protein
LRGRRSLKFILGWKLYGAHRRGKMVSMKREKGWVRSFGLVLLK